MKSFKEYLEIVNESQREPSPYTITPKNRKTYTANSIATDLIMNFQYNLNTINMIVLDEKLKKDPEKFVSDLKEELDISNKEKFRYKKAEVELLPTKDKVKVTFTKTDGY